MGIGEKIWFVGKVGIPDAAAVGTEKIVFKATSVSNEEASDALECALDIALSAPYVEILGAGESVYVGETHAFRVAYGLVGTMPRENVVLRAILPAEVHFVSAEHGGVYIAEDHVVEWNVGTLAAGSRMESSITVQIGAITGLALAVYPKAGLFAGTDLLSSDRRELRILTKGPASISLSITPHMAMGDGLSKVNVTAHVTDLSGSTVSAETEVTFTTTEGSFPGGVQSIKAPTSGGVASVELTAPLILGSTPLAGKVMAEVQEGSVRAQADVLFAQGAVVGRVIDSKTGLPESGVEVRLIQGGVVFDVTLTDEAGFYVLRAPESGDYTLVINGDSVIESMVQVEDPANQLTVGPSLILGRLIDPKTGEGVPHAEVILHDEHGVELARTVTNANGDYVL